WCNHPDWESVRSGSVGSECQPAETSEISQDLPDTTDTYGSCLRPSECTRCKRMNTCVRRTMSNRTHLLFLVYVSACCRLCQRSCLPHPTSPHNSCSPGGSCLCIVLVLLPAKSYEVNSASDLSGYMQHVTGSPGLRTWNPGHNQLPRRRIASSVHRRHLLIPNVHG